MSAEELLREARDSLMSYIDITETTCGHRMDRGLLERIDAHLAAPKELTDEQIDRAIEVWFDDGGHVPFQEKFRLRMRAAIAALDGK